MPWDYNYRAGPTGGSLVALDTYADGIWIPAEGTAGKRGSNITIPSRHGSRWRPYKFYNEGMVDIRIALRYTSSNGSITHTDGAPGHVYDNHAQIKRLFDTGLTTATIRRAMPDAGEVDLVGELIDGIRIADTQFIFSYLFRVHVPTWRAVAESSTAASPATLTGDAQVQDLTIDFDAGAVNPVFTHTPTGATCTYTGTVPAGGVRVLPNEDRAYNLTGGADASGLISFNRDYGILFFPGTNAFTFSTGTGTVRWRNQWQIG